MRRRGRASTAALAGILGVLVGAAIVWLSLPERVRPTPSPTPSPGAVSVNASRRLLPPPTFFFKCPMISPSFGMSFGSDQDGQRE